MNKNLNFFFDLWDSQREIKIYSKMNMQEKHIFECYIMCMHDDLKGRKGLAFYSRNFYISRKYFIGYN